MWAKSAALLVVLTLFIGQQHQAECRQLQQGNKLTFIAGSTLALVTEWYRSIGRNP